MAEGKPGTISADKLCELTGLTDRRHRQLAKEGWFPPPLRGEYQEAATVAGLFKYFRELVARKTDGAKVAEQRLKNAKADIAEEELLIIREKYLLKSEIGPALRNLSLHQRAVFQRKFETELGPKLSGKKTAEILALVKAGVDEVCNIFQEGTRKWLEGGGEDKTPNSKLQIPEKDQASSSKEPASSRRRLQ